MRARRAAWICAVVLCGAPIATARADVAHATSHARRGSAPGDTASASDARPGAARDAAARADTILGVRVLTFLTGDTASTRPRPLLVMLHWADSSPEELRPFLADLSVHARVVLPEGFVRTDRGWRWWPRRVAAAGVPDATDANGPQVVAAASRVAELLRAIRRRYGADDLPLVVGGVSQGGDLSFALAIRHPDVVDAALPVAGRLLPSVVRDATLDRAAPMHVFHGTADTTARYSAIVDAVDAARRAGARVVLHGYPDVAHDLPPHEAAGVRACAAALLRAGRQPGADVACP